MDENKNNTLGAVVEVKAGARNSRKDQERLSNIKQKVGEVMTLLEELGLADDSQDQPMESDIQIGLGKAADVAPMLTPGNALKALSKTDDTLRVGNYFALFGGKDLVGEFFTADTDFNSPLTDTVKRLPIDWEHRQAPDGKGIGPDASDVLGYVDWETAQKDNLGLWVERVLNRRNKYIAMIEPLIEAGLIGTSSEAIPDLVQKSDTGEIIRWPAKGEALTVSPMEPRMLTNNHLAAIKTVADNYPEFYKALFGEVKVVDQAEAGPADIVTIVNDRLLRKRAELSQTAIYILSE